MTEEHIPCFKLDGKEIPYQQGDSIMKAALDADVYIPHLCHHPELTPHGSCRVCIVKMNGQVKASCITPAEDGLQVESNIDEINVLRKRLVQMLFVEGNHFCPSCEMSGQCQLQALAYELDMLDTHFDHFYPNRKIDCTHPDIILDRDRCINCELCVRAHREMDNKNALSLGGRGQLTHLQANTGSGLIKDTELAISDKAMHVCPVGALIPKQGHYPEITGERLYDKEAISKLGNVRPESRNTEQQP